MVSREEYVNNSYKICSNCKISKYETPELIANNLN